ncbi:MAG: NADH-quinone oxidoreductase subunit NuoK [Anaerolineae bacterium]|nr:NADH-quinone oxidoreductase subunit NuoK [Anaerolineae bacterium]
MTITPNHYLLSSAILFILGLIVIAVRRQILVRLLGLQLMFQAVNLALVSLSEWFQVWEGQIAILMMMTLSVAEFALGFGCLWVRRRADEHSMPIRGEERVEK